MAPGKHSSDACAGARRGVGAHPAEPRRTAAFHSRFGGTTGKLYEPLIWGGGVQNRKQDSETEISERLDLSVASTHVKGGENTHVHTLLHGV